VRWILAAGLVVALGVVGYAWYRGGEDPLADRAEFLRIGPRKHFVVPAGEGRPLLVLLHGRGMTPKETIWPELLDAIDALGARAPTVLIADGGDHSYYHDRRDFAWARNVGWAIRAAELSYRTDPGRIAIGGFSMGGFGALDLARQRRFCAVGAHAPALWREGGETPVGAFDDAADFERHDLFELAAANPRLYRDAKVWLDVGDRDPFRETSTAFGRLIGARVRVWPGEHGTRYWRAHVDEYLRFYAAALERCVVREP
jgi:S-formylglutathione hydrolase FrmB